MLAQKGKSKDNSSVKIGNIIGKMNIIGKYERNPSSSKMKFMLPGMKKYDAESLNKELQNLRLELNKGSAKTFHELLEDLFVFLEFDNEDKVNKNFIKYIIK